MTTAGCPFCSLPPERIVAENEHSIWTYDGFPVSPGHSLIIPKRHVGYIPFSKYPRDLAHNFVLAHPACNRSKSDTLAALPHLERWLERLQRHSDALAEIGADSGFVIDAQTTQRVGSWAYGNAVASGAQAWMAANTYSAIDHRYTECFA